MSGSRAPLIVAAVVGMAGLMAVGMVAVLAAAWFLMADAEPAPEVEVEVVETEPEPEAEPKPEPVADEEPEPEPEPTREPEPEEETTTEPEGTTASEPPPSRQTSECTPNSKGITKVGPRKWKVKRSVIDKYTKNSSAASKLARVKWAKTKSGKTRGVRLTRVPCKSPLKAAGLRSKDLILEVDGKSVTSYAQGLRIWASIKRKDSFTVKIKRQGGTVVHRYVLVK